MSSPQIGIEMRWNRTFDQQSWTHMIVAEVLAGLASPVRWVARDSWIAGGKEALLSSSHLHRQEKVGAFPLVVTI